MKLTLSLLKERFAVCRLDSQAEVPAWSIKGEFFSITRTSDELSIVCPESNVDETARCEKGWACMKLEGPFAFSLTGVLNSITGPLADAGVSIFAISTYDTDYVMVKADSLEEAVAALHRAGHHIQEF